MPVSKQQPAYLTIGQVADGHPMIRRGVRLARTTADNADVGMTVCVGDTFRYKDPKGEKEMKAHRR